MKVLILGDTHGRNTWKSIITREEFDKVVFIGDYWDTHENIDFQTQRSVFLEIMKYREENPEEVVCFFGNHDLHYIIDETYSGYQDRYASKIKELILENLPNLQACIEIDRVLYSHAGVSRTWQDINLKFTPESINRHFKETPSAFGFKHYNSLRPESRFRYPNPYGDDIFQGPMWIRPNSLMLDPGVIQLETEVYTPVQVVGHTHDDHIRNGQGSWFVDALPYEYLVVEDGKKFEIKKV